MVLNSELKPAEKAERMLIEAILKNEFSINSTLPAERQLATMLGVTRTTLREALQRLARDGWLDIQQGKPTRVCDYWKEGSLGVLQSLILSEQKLPDDFISNLLMVRALLAPSYARMAVANARDEMVVFLEDILDIEDVPEAYVVVDAKLHKMMADLSGNPIFSLILNGFLPLYPEMGKLYFSAKEARDYSKGFYVDLLACVKNRDLVAVEELVSSVMKDTILFWQKSKYKIDTTIRSTDV